MTLIIMMTFSAAGYTHDYRLSDMRIAHPFAVETPPGAPTGAVYLDISNFSARPLHLISARTHMAEQVEIHHMQMNNGLMEMRGVTDLIVEPEQTLLMRPGNGYHLMLINLASQLKNGDNFPLWLTFSEHDEMRVEVRVQTREAGISAADAHHNH